MGGRYKGMENISILEITFKKGKNSQNSRLKLKIIQFQITFKIVQS